MDDGTEDLPGTSAALDGMDDGTEGLPGTSAALDGMDDGTEDLPGTSAALDGMDDGTEGLTGISTDCCGECDLPVDSGVPDVAIVLTFNAPFGTALSGVTIFSSWNSSPLRNSLCDLWSPPLKLNTKAAKYSGIVHAARSKRVHSGAYAIIMCEFDTTKDKTLEDSLGMHMTNGVVPNMQLPNAYMVRTRVMTP